MKQPLRNRNQLQFDMTAYHTKVYEGKEPLKVVGIRKSEVELQGDYSGVGLDNSTCWFSLDGVLL